MVSNLLIQPIFLIVIALVVAFTLGFFGKKSWVAAFTIQLTALGAMSVVSATWSYFFLTTSAVPEQIFTAGFNPPFAINLLMGKYEAILTLVVNLTGFLSAIYLTETFKKQGHYALIVFLIMVMGMNGIILTRDIFNLFVFMEISSIATAGVIILKEDIKTLSAGFKYMIASGLISGFMLLGIIFLYSMSGTLNIDDMVSTDLSLIKGSVLAVFMLVIAFILELKPFPANGWALDVYEAAPAGINAVISAASLTAVYFSFAKILPIAGEKWYFLTAVVGGITFLASNVLALKQDNAKRLLGYSSVSQMGLLLILLGLFKSFSSENDIMILAVLLTHSIAKAGLFWISGIVKKDKITDWGGLRKHPLLLFAFITFICALLGLPPFPVFFAKWTLVLKLAGSLQYGWIALILLASLLEAVYFFRWIGYTLKLTYVNDSEQPSPKSYKMISPFIYALILYPLGYIFSLQVDGGESLAVYYLPLLFIFTLFILDFLPVYVKNTILIAGMSYYGYFFFPQLTEFKIIFGVIFIFGGIVTLIAGYAQKGKRVGFYPFAAMMYAGLIGLLQAENVLQLFFSWELMTTGSYFLILRGKKSMPHALSYIIFSLGGAYSLLSGFGMASAANSGSLLFEILKTSGTNSGIIYLLLILGFMTKTASIGLHIWLPGAHAEAEYDVSPMVSAILLKAGVFGLMLVMLNMGSQQIGGVNLPYVLGWVGAITALVGNILAIYQEDAKKLLAYSSFGQLGYVLFALAMMSHLGWLTAIAFALNHFIFKALLFLAIGGVIMRTHTKDMYKMGGLIKNMPYSFISVLIGIIALSGVPPLTGFAGKWLSYNAILEKGWYFQGFIIAIAGLVAFLYCFRLIYAVFLGQLKDEHRHIKEAPLFMLIPQFILISVIVVFSTIPNLVLKPVGKYLVKYFPENALTWEGSLAHGPYGYWDGAMVMYITMIVFGIIFLWLLFINRKAQKVGQFNIVYAAERPYRPETTHFAYNFFAHYRKAVGFMEMPLVTGFWETITEGTNSVADFVRRVYNGNGQSYAFHIIVFVIGILLFTVGV